MLGIPEWALNVLSGNYKISFCVAKRLRRHKVVLRRLVGRGIAIGKNRKLILFLSFDRCAVGCALSNIVVMLLKVILLSTECFDLLRHDDDDDLNAADAVFRPGAMALAPIKKDERERFESQLHLVNLRELYDRKLRKA